MIVIQDNVDLTSLSMKGPFVLSAEKIDEQITGRSPGNYALGYIEGHSFIVRYVGRSDIDLNTRIKDWVLLYKHFKWSYASSEKAAYDKECRNYHDFGGSETLDNNYHPDKPDGKKWKCVVCGK